METRKTHTDHLFQYRSVEKRKLIASLSITVIVMFVEIFGAILTNSIALLSDAGHMFTHAFAIGISLLAIYIASKPPCDHKTYGLYRAEILAAFINGLFLIPIVGFIIFEAILRILNPLDINGFYMLIVAIIGLSVNISSILILQGSEKSNLGVRSVFYHMIADAASSIGIVVVAILIMTVGWNMLDPIVSFGISIIILYWAWGILRDSSRILLEVAPKTLNIDNISEDIKKKFQEISVVYNVHLWTITPSLLVFSAFVKLNNELEIEIRQNLASQINDYLFEKYNIIESTIQITSKDEPEVCRLI
jgi:cobalt-zinc-cadmium efflux system protein